MKKKSNNLVNKTAALLTLVFALALAPAVWATVYTSTGSGGSWATAGTWSPSGPPTAADSVVIASGAPVTLAANTTIAGVTINGGAVLDENGYTLTNNGNFSNSGTFKNGGSSAPKLVFGSGTSLSFTPGVKTIGAALIGGGGGGAGNKGGGGGGGGCAYSSSIMVNPSTAYTVTVGGGGTGGAPGPNSGANGTSSTLTGGSITTLTGNYGGGGASTGGAGAGGSGSGGTDHTGGAGGSGTTTTVGGGGSAAGTTGNGVAGTSSITTVNTGGGTPGGTGNPAGGVGGNIGVTPTTGYPGSFPGGGGGAGLKSGATIGGGAGANGEVVIFFPVPATIGTPTQASIGTTSATLGATLTANGGNSVTDYGVVWAPAAATTTPTTANNMVQVGTSNPSYPATYTTSVTGLPVSTQIYYAGYAVNGVGTFYSSYDSFWTLANTPSAPTVGSPTMNSLNVTIASGDGNSSTTTYAIYMTPAVGGNNWVNTDGTVVGSAVYQTASAWGTVTVAGLSTATYYTFGVYAKNGGGTVTSESGTTTVETSASATAPAVSTFAATSIGATTATLRGTVADGGSALTDYGFYYSTTSPVTTGSTQAQVGTSDYNGAYSDPLTGLNPNTYYYYRAYADNSIGNTLDTAETSFWTLANTPAAPTVSTPSINANNSLNVAIGSGDGNPSGTAYAIYETSTTKYVQANGTLGASPVWQTTNTWGAVTVTGLSPLTTYTFEVEARNGASQTTSFGPTAGGTTTSSPPPPPTGPRIAATQYSDYDVPLINIDATDSPYNADKTGVSDAAPAIQAALNAATNDWGGIVYLPAGTYLLAEALVVPDNVTLRGDWRRPTDTNKAVAGTVLLVKHGKGQVSTVGGDMSDIAFVLGYQAALRDLSIYYPDQDPANPSPYPYTVDAQGGFATTRNVTLVNSYDGMYYGAGSGGFPTAITVYGAPIHNGFYAADSGSTPRFENIHFAPEYWSESGLGTNAVTRAQVVSAMRAVGGVGILVGGGGGGAVYIGDTISGYDTGVRAFADQSPRWFDIGITNCRIGMDILYGKDHGWTITKGRVDAEETAVRLGTNCAHIAFNNFNFTSNGKLIDHDAGTLTFVNCTFERWGSGAYAIDSHHNSTDPNTSDTQLSVAGCNFNQSANHINLQSTVSRAVIYANTPAGSALKVNNQAGGLPNIVIDTTNSHSFAQMDPVPPIEDFFAVHRHVPPPPPGTNYVFNVNNYGAPGTGTNDVTLAFSNALARAGSLATSNAGCIVYVPAGVYTIKGRLTVPSNVELRGIHDGGISDQTRSILCLFADKGLTNKPATITLADNSGISGLAIFRPEQTWHCTYTNIADQMAYISTNLFPYPFAIQGSNANWAYNILLANTYDGIDFSRGGGHRLEFVYACSLDKMITIGSGVTGDYSQVVNLQGKTDAWRLMSQKNNFPVLDATHYGDGSPNTVGVDNGLGLSGIGVETVGNGTFRMMAHFINQTGDTRYHIIGSPTLNMWLGGGEGSGEGIRIDSDDGTNMDIEVVGNSYHLGGTFTDSHTSTGDRLTLINCKGYGGANTNHMFTGSGNLVAQQDYRGEIHNVSEWVDGSATAIIEGGFFDGNSTVAVVRALNSSRAMLCGAVTAVSNWDFDPADQSRINVQSVCPAVLIGISGTGGTPPPVAGFTATPTNGTLPLPVTFTDTSTGAITNLLWFFGDDQTTNTPGGAVVSRTYTNAGSYTVTLIASGAGGTSTNTQTGYITVNPPQPPKIGGIGLQGMTNIVFTGSGGPTNGTYYYWVRSSTNLTLPSTNWSVVSTNQFNADGSFSNSLPIPPAEPQRFYRLQLP